MSPSIAILSTRRLEKSASSTNCSPQIPPFPIAVATARHTPYTARTLPWPPAQTPLPKSIAAMPSPAPETAPAVPAAPLLLPASPASAAVTPAPAPAAASGKTRTPACAPTLPAPARGPVVVRCTAGKSFHRDVPSNSRVMAVPSRGPSRGQRPALPQRLPQFMPRPQQHHAHKRAAHSQLVGNFVVTHIRVIAHHQRHPCSRPQFVQRAPHFFAGTLLN